MYLDYLKWYKNIMYKLQNKMFSSVSGLKTYQIIQEKGL